MAEQNVFRMNKKLFYTGIIASLMFCIVGIGVLMLIHYILRYKYTTLTVTDIGLDLRKGWLNVSHKQVPFSKINNIDVKVGLIGRSWGYGNIKVFSGNDIEAIAFLGVDRPYELKRLVESRI